MLGKCSVSIITRFPVMFSIIIFPGCGSRAFSIEFEKSRAKLGYSSTEISLFYLLLLYRHIIQYIEGNRLRIFRALYFFLLRQTMSDFYKTRTFRGKSKFFLLQMDGSLIFFCVISRFLILVNPDKYRLILQTLRRRQLVANLLKMVLQMIQVFL